MYEPDLYPERKKEENVRNMLKSGNYWDILCYEVQLS
jgi:hypothetical protein